MDLILQVLDNLLKANNEIDLKNRNKTLLVDKFSQMVVSELKNIFFKKIQQQTLDFTYNLDDSDFLSPFPLEYLVEYLKIKILEIEDPTQYNIPMIADAFLFKINEWEKISHQHFNKENYQWVIILNKKRQSNFKRNRFTIAHEIGHLVLHCLEQRKNEFKNNKILDIFFPKKRKKQNQEKVFHEIFCDKFSANLLIPPLNGISIEKLKDMEGFKTSFFLNPKHREKNKIEIFNYIVELLSKKINVSKQSILVKLHHSRILEDLKIGALVITTKIFKKRTALKRKSKFPETPEPVIKIQCLPFPLFLLIGMRISKFGFVKTVEQISEKVEESIFDDFILFYNKKTKKWKYLKVEIFLRRTTPDEYFAILNFLTENL